MNSVSNKISVILVCPQGSMNIGMAARAMRNFEIKRLKLVTPEHFNRQQADMMACNAKDVVDKAEFFDKLEDALSDETCSVAFSRRLSKDRDPHYPLEEIMPTLAKRLRKGNLALVFGRETDGLTQEEIYQCDFRVYIPTTEDNACGSINLAQAVLIACYEISRLEISGPVAAGSLATNAEIKPMLKDFDKLLKEIGYDNKGDFPLRKKIIQAFREIIGRAGLRPKDVNMFLGIFGQVRKNLRSQRRGRC